MTDISSVTSSAGAFVAKQAAELNKAAGAVTTSFANVLAKVPSAVGVRPATGFVPGPTYEANTLAGRTKAAFNNTQNFQPSGTLQSQSADSPGLLNAGDSSPITGETSKSWPIVRFLLTLLVVFALMYFFLHR